MARFLLYVALQNEGDSQAEFETYQEAAEAVKELVTKTFESGRQLITFSIGDITDYGDEEFTVVDGVEEAVNGQG